MSRTGVKKLKGGLEEMRLTGCRHRIALLLAAWLLCLLPAAAEANAGPPRVGGDTGGPLLPGRSDQVHVLGESLRFDLHPGLDRATVTARYRLANRGPALEAQPFIFVVQDSGERVDLTAAWQGHPVPVTMEWGPFAPDELAEMAAAWTTVDVWLDPVTGEPYSDHVYGQDTVLRYFRFTLDLPAEAEGELVVTYDHVAARDRTRWTYPVYQYHYLLLPALGWASFGPLEIRVAAPEGTRWYFAGNLDFRQEGGEYVAEYPGLPDANLAFAVMNRSGLFLGPRPAPYYWLGCAVVLLLAAAIGGGIGWLAGRLPGRGWAAGVGSLGGLLLGGALDVWLAVNLLVAIPALREQAYGPAFVGIGGGLAGAVVSAIVAGRVARRTWLARSGVMPAGGGKS